jgi:hypothetical protein
MGAGHPVPALLEEGVAAQAVGRGPNAATAGRPQRLPDVTASRSSSTSIVRTLRAKKPASRYAFESLVSVIFGGAGWALSTPLEN